MAAISCIIQKLLLHLWLSQARKGPIHLGCYRTANARRSHEADELLKIIVDS